jgi:nucleoside-diphosphate-sugar epimerase
MRIVVLGATGNVGTSLIEALGRDDRVREIVGVARRPPAMETDKTRYVEADVATDNLEPHFRGADVVVHLAWLFQPTHHPMVTWNANAIGSQRVFDAAATAGVGAVVYASSIGAYSPGRGRTVDESWPTNSVPTAGYGREKAYVERVLDAFEARHPEIRVVRMRPAFIFKEDAGSAQRRLFLGPFFPNLVVRPGRLPLVPVPAGLRFQTLHTDDAADAFCRAALRDVRGAFNLAADPVMDGARVAKILGGRAISLPRPLLRTAVAAAWQLHAAPTEPALLDLFLDLPVMDTSRARSELGWSPAHSAEDALREALIGMAEGRGAPTAPLAPDSLPERVHEATTGVGERDH